MTLNMSLSHDTTVPLLGISSGGKNFFEYIFIQRLVQGLSKQLYAKPPKLETTQISIKSK